MRESPSRMPPPQQAQAPTTPRISRYPGGVAGRQNPGVRKGSAASQSMFSCLGSRTLDGQAFEAVPGV
jgi:hypothetical protein